MSKKICLIIGNLSGGGAERVTINLATALAKLGHQVDVILSYNKIDYSLDDFNFKVHIVAPNKNALQKTIELNGEYDLIVSSLYREHKVCKEAKLPNMYFCIHSTISMKLHIKYSNLRLVAYLGRGPLKFIRKTAHYFDKINHPFFVKDLYKNQNLITVSDGVKTDLLKFGVKPKTVQTIYNPFDFNYIKQQAEKYKVEEQDYIIHVGRFVTAKRHDILIRAYAQSGIKQKLIILGDTCNDVNTNRITSETRKIAEELGLQDQDKVIFKGFISNPYPYIKNAKALVLSSDFEGLPTVLIEALILGVPIVSTDCPSGANEILIHDLAQFLSPVGDVEALAANIKKMIDNPIKITEKYFARFSSEKSAEQYLALCKK